MTTQNVIKLASSLEHKYAQEINPQTQNVYPITARTSGSSYDDEPSIPPPPNVIEVPVTIKLPPDIQKILGRAEIVQSPKVRDFLYSLPNEDISLVGPTLTKGPCTVEGLQRVLDYSKRMKAEKLKRERESSAPKSGPVINPAAKR